jgi:hypothetical protein
MLTDENGTPIHAPKPLPPNTSDLRVTVTDTTQWDCYNLYPGIYWHPERSGERTGPCVHYDDSEYHLALAEWEEKQAEFLQRLQENDV